MLETTTITLADGGAILTEQIVIPDGMIRDVLIEARFGGFPHQFPISLAPSGTNASRYPGCARPGHTKLMRTRETWHWTDGPPPSPTIFKGMPVIEWLSRPKVEWRGDIKI
ncbi:hypothetical protein [Brevundimonas vancanneytii]|uniref:Uncharacterized protein n=1 Tax=Brevundimonas vancanneytii TaxID=1325724 RepID=A0A4P1JUA9_9CAUL|nr:hypothetical protein [Brevundimonas vancanneytii]VTO11284.1 Uncharacterised protein [Brevundimonas vancanneytii]